MAVISADLCEMNLVSNVTGLVPSDRRLNYPIAKISELADIFIPEEDGGILEEDRCCRCILQSACAG
ncbi:MAG: hypothetical protein ACLRZZ_02900 [Enterocloster sp.]